jgi:2-furoyl-CoA dehydrogenase large subunit
MAIPRRPSPAPPRRVALTVHYPRNSCTPIECGVVVAEHLPGTRATRSLSNFMGPFSLHSVMALALKVPGNKLRHKVPRDSGGSFGVKQAVLPYVVLMCLASRKAGAPVKWVEDRLEHLSRGHLGHRAPDPHRGRGATPMAASPRSALRPARRGRRLPARA